MSHGADHESATRKIFIGGLSYSTDEDKLRDYFEKFGPVQDAVVMKDPVTKRSRGFGFITFDASIYVDIALEQDVHMIDSRKVEAKRAVPRSEVPGSSKDAPPAPAAPTPSPKITASAPATAAPVVHAPATTTNSSSSSSTENNSSKYNSDDYAYHKIFVGGLHYDTRDAEFRAYFELYGRVLSAEVMFNRETHKSRGFGFIIFEQESSVDLVCEERDHIIDGKMVEVKRAVPRTKGPMSSSSSSSSKSHSQAASVKAGSSSGGVSAKGGVSEASIGVKKHNPGSGKTATSVAIATVGMRTKPPPAKSATTSYAAALRAGNNAPEPDVPVNPIEAEYPPLVPSKVTPAPQSVSERSPVIEPATGIGSTDSVGRGSMSSQHSSPRMSGSAPSPKQIGSPMQLNQHQSKSPGARSTPGSRELLPAPNLSGALPNMMLPQSVGHVTHEHLLNQQIPLPGPPQRGFTQPQNQSEFEGFDMNRPVRAFSESFVPQNYPNQVSGLGGYYGNAMPPVSRDPFCGGDVGGFSQPRADSLGDVPGGHHLYENHSRGLQQPGPGSYDGGYGFSGGNPGQFGMQPQGQLGGLGWLPVSLSAGGAGAGQGSELDSAGEDAIGLGLALSMDLNDIQSQSQFGGSRVVSGEGRFDSQRSRGPAPSYLPGENSGPVYGSSSSLGGWSVGSSSAPGLQMSPGGGGRSHAGSFGSAPQQQQEWYPQLNDLRSSAAEFKPTSGSNSGNINSNGSMSWDHSR